MRRYVHPSLVKCRINVSPAPGQRPSQFILTPVDHGVLESIRGDVYVTLDTSEDLPSRIVSVRYCGVETELYSIIYNGKKTRGRFART